MQAQTSTLLTGTALSDNSSKAQETKALAFDGSRGKHFVSGKKSHAWVGLDLGQKHVITRIEWAARGFDDSGNQTTAYKASARLAVFEGANSPDFMDAIPLYMITDAQESDPNVWVYYPIDINVSRGFQYVRYVAPDGTDGSIGELRFYGYASEGDDTQFYQPTNLPLVVIHTETGNDPVDKVTNINATSSVIYVSKKGNSKIIGETVASTVRGRGNASWSQFPKKPLRIKYDKKVEMPYGGGSYKKWTLISNYSDKTLMRNMLAYDMSERMEMAYTPYCQPVDFMLNGEYKGTYQLCDQIEVGEGRVDIDELKAKDTGSDKVTGGYFYEYDGNSSQYYDLQTWLNATVDQQNSHDLGFYTNRYADVFSSDNRKGNPVTIKSPDEDKMAQEHFDYLKGWLNSAENEIYHRRNAMNDYIDYESFARFFITSEFAGNTDTFFELYQYKKRDDKKVYFGPCWDFDIAYSNDYRTYQRLNSINQNEWLCLDGGTFIEGYSPIGDSRGHMKLYTEALLNNSRAMQTLKENWAYARTDEFVSKASLQQVVDDYAAELDQSQRLNFMRWPILGQNVHMNYNSSQAPTYQAQVDRVKNYIATRMNFMDRKLGLGSVQTFSLTISSTGWSTLYLPFAFSVPEGLTVYSVVGLTNGTELKLEEVTMGRPNRAYLVKGNPGTYTLRGYGAPFEHKRTNGLLVGHNIREVAPDGSYVLQNHDGVLAFYRVNYDKAKPNVPVNRAYLWIPDFTISSSAPDRFILDENEETGIGEMMAEETTGGEVRVYSLTGQLLLEHDGSLSAADVAARLGAGNYILTDETGSRKISF